MKAFLLVAAAIIAATFFNKPKVEVNTMAAIYVALIIKGVKTFSQVPKRIKEEVRQMLIDLDLEYLIEE